MFDFYVLVHISTMKSKALTGLCRRTCDSVQVGQGYRMHLVHAMRPGTNPIHALLHEHMGIDSFALDGDDTETPESWMERRRSVTLRRGPR